MQLSNQVVEDFLKEAITMRKFDHPNVLNMFGISVYEQKPCIVLPLMSNGDLKKYVKAKKPVSVTYIVVCVVAVISEI